MSLYAVQNKNGEYLYFNSFGSRSVGSKRSRRKTMTKSETEIWKAHPEYAWIEVSTLGNVRTLDMLESSEERTQFTKGRVLKQYETHDGYLRVKIKVDSKWTKKRVHRLIAQTFIPNPEELPQVNHRDCDRKNNNVENLEWCDNSYNMRYREKYGTSNTESRGHHLFAVNLATLEVSRFRSQNEAGRELEISPGNINKVIKGKRNQTGGYWFVSDDGHKDVQIQQKIAEGQQAVAQKQAEVDAKQQTVNSLNAQLEAAKQDNNNLSQAILDAQSVREYSDQVVKSAGAQ